MKHRFLFLSILLFCGVALSTLNAKNIEQGKLPDGGYWTLNDDGTELFIHAKKIPDCGVVSHRGGEGDPLGPEKKGEYCFVTDAPYCALAKTVTTIIFSDDIVYIGNNAFRGFSKLVQVTFDKKNYVNEKTLVDIGDYAFSDCSQLQFMTFNYIRSIGHYAFSHTALHQVLLPQIQQLGEAPFAYCPNLQRSLNVADESSIVNYDIMPSVLITTGKMPEFTGTRKKLSEFIGKGDLRFLVLVNYSDRLVGEYGGLENYYKEHQTDIERIVFGRELDYSYSDKLSAYWYMRTPTEMIVNFIGLNNKPYNTFENTYIPCRLAKKLRYNGTKYVGKIFFQGFSDLEEVILDNSVEEILDGAFEYCKSLKKINGLNIKSIGVAAFNGCSAVESLNFTLCNEIRKHAFEDCTSLESIQLNSVTNIYDEAFKGCTKLSDIYLGAPPKVSKDVFADLTTSSITLHVPYSFAISYDSDTWRGFNIDIQIAELPLQSDGWSLSKDGKLVITDTKWFVNYDMLEQMPWHAYRNQITSISVEELAAENKGLAIGNYMFCQLPNLEEASFQGVAAIGDYAFSQCPKLRSVGNSLAVVSTIGEGAFEGCSSLNELSLGKCKSIGPLAFYGCTSLTSLSCSANTPPIVKSNTFDGIADGNQSTVVLDVLNSSLLAYAKADYWKNFRFAAFNDHGDIISAGRFYDGIYILYADGNLSCSANSTSNANTTKNALSSLRTQVKSITVSGEISYLGDIFQNFTSLTDVTLHGGITYLNQTFYGCTKLKSISMPGVESIGDYAFLNCSSLDDINISQVKQLGKNCFENSGIREFDAKNVKIVGDYAFKNCTQLQEGAFSETATEIGTNVFQGCTNLKKFDFNGKTLKEGMFNGCSALTSVTLGSNVASVEADVFAGTALSEIYYDRARPATIDYDGYENIFSGITASEITLYVPAPCINTFKAVATWRNMNIVENTETNADVFSLPHSGYFAIADDSWTLNENRLLTVEANGEMTQWLSQEDRLYNGLEQWMPYVTALEVVGETTSTMDYMIPSDRGNGISGITTLTLGKNIQTVGRSFNQLYHLERVNCFAEDVPQIDDNAFDWNVIDNNSVKLHVPNKPGVRDAYRQNSNWKKFQIIADLGEVYIVTLNANYGYIEVQESVNLNAVPQNTVLHLTAVPASGYRFVEWDNYNPATGLKVTGDVTVTATFERIDTGIEDVTLDNNEGNNQVRKVLIDGLLYIIMPDGKTYNIQGQRIK